ncbi:elongation of very long chain fatty acids protein [Trichonephila clavata]|uniref:Elongation of very long chain fatty acids protein n=1 Tax=Trichonephila clavata TaxID=2740835 RepID=A0A8X6L0J8_TRICU|nr:elongation of very long chain fatty acids protein [Trichonephila clavata]
MQNSKITWFRTDFNWRCQSIDWSENEESLNAAKIGWIFLIIKLLELFDTIFLVLWKEDSEISLKHLYLQVHSPLLVWYGLKFAPGGYNSLYTMLSSFVGIWNHVYFMSKVSKPSHMEDICLKKLVSILHLVFFWLQVSESKY